MNLPPGYTWRPMCVDDAALIAERSAEYTTALLGFVKHSPEDVANYLRDPGTNPATNGWLVSGPDGSFAGSATAVPITNGTHVVVDILSTNPTILTWLLAQAEHRATTPGCVVRVGAIRQDERLAGVLAERGYVVDTSVQRMRIAFDGVVEAPAVPEGFVVRRGALDEARRRAAHAVLMEAFAEQPGTLPRAYDEWVASRESRSTFDWSQVTIVERAGQAVAMTECNDNFVSTETCGYVGRLAVVSSARGRGLAKYLLRNAFAVDAAAGRTGTILHVDTSNPTPAVALYTAIGMCPDLISDIWTRVPNNG
ncbi:GNAT family N-acetyltransferase [Kribbella sp.]|uniref:GNAT family N-acetyltransferase n=1 Tax=Kribbella sp. TaxID=1871183 RepID=UPI002D6F38C5|nr:GNAT family N-acetyltransferase [Kribbella sp.]HZX03637.1 GNAT family N-acetyltransferase [Kribbella sp.]